MPRPGRYVVQLGTHHLELGRPEVVQDLIDTLHPPGEVALEQGRRRGGLGVLAGWQSTSEVKVPTLLQPFPICKLPTQGEATIFGKTQDVERLVVDEL